ncbi:MAG: secondary thiamine-phosphate synthase enzyme YjbQ [Henriciella sp.]
MQAKFELSTHGPGLHEFTSDVAAFVDSADQRQGLLTLFCQHTSCSLVIQENADPDVLTDLKAFFARLVPDANDPSMSYLLHRAEGPDDMPAHIKTALTQTSISIPISEGRLVLGTWQGIYLFEHRSRPHTRSVVAHISA